MQDGCEALNLRIQINHKVNETSVSRLMTNFLPPIIYFDKLHYYFFDWSVSPS